MTPVEVVLTTLMRSLLQAGSREAARGVRAWLSRRPTRRRTYQELQARVVRARLRTTLCLQLQTQVVDTVVPLGGVQGALVGVLDHVVVDMSDVLAAWLLAREVAPEPLAEASDELVLALGGLLAHPDPGWWRPRSRTAHRHLAAASEHRFDLALAEFVRLVTADTDPKRRARRAAARADPGVGQRAPGTVTAQS